MNASVATPRPDVLPKVAADRRAGLLSAIGLGFLIVLAFALRFWRLGSWAFEGDEIFTLRDSINQPRFSNPRPLLYFLNYYVVRPIVPLDELGLRLLPAIFGVLAIPAFYVVCRRLVGTRAAFFGALFLTVNSLHVYQSQYARYWSLVFLLSAVYPFAIYLGIRERDQRMLALGIATGVLAVLAHPVSVLLVGGLALWLVATNLQQDRVARLWNQWSVRWGAFLMAILIGVIAIRYIPILHSWIQAHNGTRPSEHLLRLPSGPGVTQVGTLLSYVEGLSLSLVLSGALGIYLLWQKRDRSLALLLACLFIFPLAFLILLSFVTAVSTTYFLPTAPIFFIGAGVFIDRLAGMNWELSPRWLPAATVAIIIVAPGLPTLISQYLDGRRNDFRGTAQWLNENLAPGDIVYSDQYRVLAYYFKRAKVEQLAPDPVPLIESAHELHKNGGGGSLWIVVPYSSRGGHRTHPKLGKLKGWIYHNCQLQNTVGVARLDFRQNELQIYRCPPAPPEDGSLRQQRPQAAQRSP